jgi:iron complex transport system substrate-binding protein
MRYLKFDKMVAQSLWAAIFLVQLSLVCGQGSTSSAAQHLQQDAEASTRIVSLVPNLTEIAFSLGAGSQVVGVSDYCLYPPEAQTRPKVGALVNPSTEAILRLKPDVVLLFRSQADFAGRLRHLGIRAELYSVDSLSDLYSAIEKVGVETGRVAAAKDLTRQVKSDLAALRPAPDSPRRAPSAVLIVSRDPTGLRNLYQATFLGEIFEAVGGRLAIPGQAPVRSETIIRADPDIIIDFSYAAAAALSTTSEETSGPDPFTGPWARLSTLKAVKAGSVYKWADPHALLLGPGVVDTARKMKELIGP